MQQQQQQHMQRHQQGAGPEQQAGGGQLMPRAEGWVANGAGRVGAAGGPGPCGGAEAEASSAGPADRPGTSKAAAGEEEEEEEEDPLGDWGEWVEGECSDDGELLPGEDWLECQFCRNWVRGSRIQVRRRRGVPGAGARRLGAGRSIQAVQQTCRPYGQTPIPGRLP